MPPPKVRADYDRLTQIAARFDQEAGHGRQTLQRLKQHIDVLQGGDWVGQGARAFYQEMQADVLPALQRLVRALDAANRTTQQISQIIRQAEDEASRFLRADGSATGAAAGAGTGAAGGATSDGAGAAGGPGPSGGPSSAGAGAAGGPGSPGPGGGGAGPGAGSADGGILGRMLSLVTDSGPGAGRMLVDLAVMALEGGGRTDGIFGFLARNIPREGTIGRMLRSKTFSGALTGLDVVSGILNDVNSPNYDGNLTRVVGVNVINTGVNLALDEFGVGLVNSGVQLAGGVQAGINRVAAGLVTNDAATERLLLQDADRLSDAVGRSDLNNVTRAYSGTLYDTFADRASQTGQAFQQAWNNPSATNIVSAFGQVGRLANSLPSSPTFMQEVMSSEAGRRGALNTGRAAVNLVDGLMDSTQLRLSSGLNMGIALVAQRVNNSGLPPQMRSAFTDASRSVIEGVQAHTARFTNLINLGDAN